MGEFQHDYDLKKQDSSLPLYNASVARKRAEQDSILLANRIRLLRAEEEKTRKKISETENKTNEVLELRRRQEERRLAKEVEEMRRFQEEQYMREMQNREREDRQKKLGEGQRSIMEQRSAVSNAVRLEREAQMREISERRAIEAAETKAKAESVRASMDAASRSRARSEGAKQEAAKSIVRDRMVREEETRQAKLNEIDKMEREEAALIARLQHSQERHKAAFMQLEDALRSDGPPPMLTNGGNRSQCATPLASHRVADRPRALGVGASNGNSVRPPRPRGGMSTASTVPRVPSNARHVVDRPDSATRVSARVSPVKIAHLPVKDASARAMSSCSTASGAESGPAATNSSPSTPSSAALAPISYTTVDGAQIDIPAEEELDLNSLLNC